MTMHAVRCKKTGISLGMKLDGGTCMCPSADECREYPNAVLTMNRGKAEKFVREIMTRLKPWETPDEQMVKFGVELILYYEKPFQVER